MLKLLFLFLYLAKLCNCTNRPVIGILAQEIEPDDPNKPLNYTSYLAAAYVKAVEASGARVAPVLIARDVEYYINIASNVNGFVYTGGSSDLLSGKSAVARTGRLIFSLVYEMNKAGIRIPILGVCQGFEMLGLISNSWKEVLTDCRVENEALSLKLLPGYKNSSLYGEASADDINILTNLPSTSNHHSHCLTQKNLTKFDLNMWRVLSTSVSHSGFEFVSSMEWKGMPIAAVQFHPEKSPYEWKPDQANPHDAKSIRAERLFYDWLVAQARLNNNSFNHLQDEQDSLIYNYPPFYTGKQGGYDVQNYYFYDPVWNFTKNDL